MRIQQQQFSCQKTSLLLAFLLPLNASAQTLSGYVRDEETGENLSQVNIHVFNKNIATQSNSYGFFSIQADLGSISNQTGQLLVSWTKPRPGQNEYFRLLGSIDFQNSFIPFFYWDTELALWQTESQFEAGPKITSPLGNFDFSQNDSVEVNIVLESLHEDWYDFNGKLDAFQTRTSFTKKFEAPIYFKSNLNNALGIFSSATSTELTLKMYK